MKMRSQFVSNSSSSSFLVGFDKIPDSIDELRRVLFGDVEWVYADWLGRYKSIEVAKAVFSDLKSDDVDEDLYEKHGIVTRDEAERELDENHGLYASTISYTIDGRRISMFQEEEIIPVFGSDYEDVPEFREWFDLWKKIDSLHGTDDWRKAYDLTLKANRIVNDYIKKTRDDVFNANIILITEYSDNESVFCAFMEHGDIFRNIPYIKIDKH